MKSTGANRDKSHHSALDSGVMLLQLVLFYSKLKWHRMKCFFKKKKKVWLTTSQQHWRTVVRSKCLGEEYYGLKFFTNSCNLLVKFSTEATIKRWSTLLFVIVFQFFKESDLSCVVSSKKNPRHLNGMNTETDVSMRSWDVVNPAAPKLTKTMRNLFWISAENCLWAAFPETRQSWLDDGCHLLLRGTLRLSLIQRHSPPYHQKKKKKTFNNK